MYVIYVWKKSRNDYQLGWDFPTLEECFKFFQNQYRNRMNDLAAKIVYEEKDGEQKEVISSRSFKNKFRQYMKEHHHNTLYFV